MTMSQERPSRSRTATLVAALAWAASAALGAGLQQAPSSAQALRTMPTRQVAARLLPSELAAGVVTHRVRDGSGGVPDAVELLRAPERVGRGVCRRHGYYLSGSDLIAGRETGMPTRFTEIALAAVCPSTPDASYARVQPAAVEPGAIAALEILADLRVRARRTGKAPVKLDCRSELLANPCKAKDAALLRDLPLERAFLIEPLAPDPGWRFALMPKGPGQPFFDTALVQPPGKRMRVAVTWKAPALF